MAKLFGNVSQVRLRESEIAGKCHSADGLRDYERQVSWSSVGGYLSGERWQAGGGVVGAVEVDERGNEYLATTNDCCPHENKGAALSRVAVFPVAAAGVGFRANHLIITMMVEAGGSVTAVRRERG